MRSLLVLIIMASFMSAQASPHLRDALNMATQKSEAEMSQTQASLRFDEESLPQWRTGKKQVVQIEGTVHMDDRSTTPTQVVPSKDLFRGRGLRRDVRGQLAEELSDM